MLRGFLGRVFGLEVRGLVVRGFWVSGVISWFRCFVISSPSPLTFHLSPIKLSFTFEEFFHHGGAFVGEDAACYLSLGMKGVGGIALVTAFFVGGAEDEAAEL